MKKNIVFITGNEGKRKEVEAIVGSKNIILLMLI
jgi:inosine/xanthosine triphosphate pyrophosphatase family protein